MTLDEKRCVITGLGMICAIGNSVDECWKNALASVSGIGHTNTVDTTGCYSDYAAEVHCEELDALEGTDGMDRVSKLCIKATREAMRDAGYTDFGGSDRACVVMGSCVGGVVSIENYYTKSKKKEYIEQMPISAIAAQVAGAVKAGGVVTNTVNACAAGTIAISYAADLIRAGKADVVIAGGADAFASVPYSGFLALHATSPDPCSPFNRSTGLTLGEGAGVVVVESYEHAKKRNAKLYCDVLGSTVTSDAYHITSPDPEGRGQIRAVHNALKYSGLKESDIGYVNAHGTATAKNDAAEAYSAHLIFDGKNDDISISSTKAMTGHCLGAAGAIEAVFCIKALTTGMIPPTLGFSEEELKALPEKAGKIDFVPNVPRKKALNNVMNNSFAFGGTNASIIFGKAAGDVKKPEPGTEICVTGFGAVTPLGNGVDSYIAAVKSGASAEGFDIRSAFGAPDFDAVGVNMSAYRKMDRFSQLVVISGMQAIHESGMELDDGNAADIGIIIGTSDAALGIGCDYESNISEQGNAKGSAFKFPNTVYNAAGGYLSICAGVKGYGVTISNGAQTGIESIAYASDIIRSGRASAMLAAGADENSDIMKELYTGLGVVSDEFVSPYSFKTAAFPLSDGGVSLMLESAEHASSRDARIYCKVAGYGVAHHAVRFATIKGSEEALDRAIAMALSEAGLAAGDIDAVIGFADGHKDIDAAELDAYRRVFGEKLAALPILSVKERTGEGRAASAALSAMHAALMLHGDIKEDNAFFAGKSVTRGKVKSDKLKNILITSFGAGGTYCAVILTK